MIVKDYLKKESLAAFFAQKRLKKKQSMVYQESVIVIFMFDLILSKSKSVLYQLILRFWPFESTTNRSTNVQGFREVAWDRKSVGIRVFTTAFILSRQREKNRELICQSIS